MKASDIKVALLDNLAITFKSKFGLKQERLGFFKHLSKDVDVGLTQNNRLWGSDGVEISLFVNIRSQAVYKFLNEMGGFSDAKAKNCSRLVLQVGYLESSGVSKHWEVRDLADIKNVVERVCETVEASVIPFWLKCSDLNSCVNEIQAKKAIFTNEEYFVPVALMLLGRHDEALLVMNEHNHRADYIEFRSALNTKYG